METNHERNPFVYSTDFVRLDRKLLISYDSAEPHSSFVRVLSIDGEELIKEKCTDNLDDLWRSMTKCT